MNCRLLYTAVLTCALALMSASCSKDSSTDPDILKEALYRNAGVNLFAINSMQSYYLWTDEISSALEDWRNNDFTADPVEKVEKVRYKVNGKDVDRWTLMTDDIESFLNSTAGVSTTYGCDIVLKYFDRSSDIICAVITVVYKDSPAEKAGLKRGDTIVEINGEKMNSGNYYELATEGFIYSPGCTLGLYDRESGKLGKSVSMSAVEMYENPLICDSTFDVAGKKVGYLAYTGFTLSSIEDLIKVCGRFKAKGVKELILDLRYNGGGYVITEEAFASMLAPSANVNAGDVLGVDVYNRAVTEYYLTKKGEDGLKRFFSTSFMAMDENGCFNIYSTNSANIGIDKLYVLIGPGTASASESLIVEMMPYLDVEIIGEQSHGKYCSGIIIEAEDWYEEYQDVLSEKQYSLKEYVSNWGMYLMIGAFADKNGLNPCRPDGLKPDIEVVDVPETGYQLGDERESLLKTALIRAGRKDLENSGKEAVSAAYTHSMNNVQSGRSDNASSTSFSISDRTGCQIVKPLSEKRILTSPIL